MDKSDERKCNSTARKQAVNMQQQAAAGCKIRADGAFISFKRGAVFAMKCGGAKARNSMRAYVQVRRDLEDRAVQKIQRRVIVKG